MAPQDWLGKQRTNNVNNEKTIRGIEWFLEKRWSWKFWPDLDILEAFEMGIKASFLGDFASRSLHYF